MSVFVADLSNTSHPSYKLKRGTLGYTDTDPHAHNLSIEFAPSVQAWAHFNSSQGLRTAQGHLYQQPCNIHISLPHNPTTSPLLRQHPSDTPSNWLRAPSQQKTSPSHCWLVLCWLSKLNWPSHVSSRSSCQQKGEAGSQDYRCTDSHRPTLLLNQTPPALFLLSFRSSRNNFRVTQKLL